MGLPYFSDTLGECMFALMRMVMMSYCTLGTWPPEINSQDAPRLVGPLLDKLRHDTEGYGSLS